MSTHASSDTKPHSLKPDAALEPQQTHESIEPLKSLCRQPTQHDDDDEGNRANLSISRIDSVVEEEFIHRVLTSQSKYDTPMPKMGEYKPLPPVLKDRSKYRVEFTEDDPMCPMNWKWQKKFTITALLTFTTAIISMGSSVWGPIGPAIEPVFHVGTTVAALGTSLYVAGFAAGPLVWGPMSEYVGRKPLLIISLLVGVCFNFASATAENYQTLTISRFFCGLFGSANLSLVPSVMADMFPPAVRGTITALYAFAVMGGPLLGPVISGFVVSSYLGWRWPLYLTGIALAAGFAAVVLFFEESYHPKVLCTKAAELRERTGNWAIYAQHETVNFEPVKMLRSSVGRPFVMLAQEPILILLSLYGGFVYGLLYMCLSSVPIIFKGYGWQGGVLMLPYLSMFIGCGTGCLVYAGVHAPSYAKILRVTGKRVVPEARLPAMMISGPIFSIGLFWMCWTGAYPKTPEHPNGCHFMVPTVGMALFGYGFMGIFLSMTNYLVDSYLFLSASSQAANVFVRSSFGAAFPLFSTQMFHNLGIQWAGTLIGCLSAILVPVPFLFYIYGAKIRTLSKYAQNLEEVEAEHEPESENDKIESDDTSLSTGRATSDMRSRV